MYQYVNGFSCAVNPVKNEIILSFLQHTPALSDDFSYEDSDKMKDELVTSLIMNDGFFRKLTEVLNQILEENFPKNDSN